MRWLKLLFLGIPMMVALGIVRVLDRARVSALLALLLAAVLTPSLCLTTPTIPDTLSDAEIAQLQEALLARVKQGGPNHTHAMRLLRYAPPFAEAAGAHVDAVRAAALLHDATKENGVEDPKERFCSHGEHGAQYADQVLTGMGKSDEFRAAVRTAINEHMGPCGFNWRFLGKRFMSRFCADRVFPTPSNVVSEVLYDIDMLDLMTVGGVLKVVTLRQTNPEFKKEPIKDSALTGADSAWKSVVDAQQTLITSAARDCGAQLTAHTRNFLDAVNWDQVADLTAFSAAVREYQRVHPIPACLPAS